MERRNVGRFFFFLCHFLSQFKSTIKGYCCFPSRFFFFVFMIMKEEEKKFSFQEMMAPTIETSHERIVFFFPFWSWLYLGGFEKLRPFPPPSPSNSISCFA